MQNLNSKTCHRQLLRAVAVACAAVGSIYALQHPEENLFVSATSLGTDGKNKSMKVQKVTEEAFLVLSPF